MTDGIKGCCFDKATRVGGGEQEPHMTWKQLVSLGKEKHTNL